VPALQERHVGTGQQRQLLAVLVLSRHRAGSSMITLVFTALWWLMLASMACSLAVTIVALAIYFHDLLGHSEAKQEGRAAAGRPPNQLVAARALGNAKEQGAPDMDKVRRSMFLDDRPLLTLVQQQDGRHLYVHRRTLDPRAPGLDHPWARPASYPDGTRDEVTRSMDVIADLAAAPGDDTPDAA